MLHELSRASQSKDKVSHWLRGKGMGSYGRGLGASVGPGGISAMKEGGILGIGNEACVWAEGTSGKLRNGVALGMEIAAGDARGTNGRVQLKLGLEEWGPGLLYRLSRASQSKNKVSDWLGSKLWGSHGKGLGASIGPQGASARKEGRKNTKPRQ